MNCDDFSQRMHEQLDHRMPLEGDPELWQHADRCESCKAQIEAWQQIAPLVGRESEFRPSVRGRERRKNVLLAGTVAAGLAAGFLFAFSGIPAPEKSAQPTMAESLPAPSSPLLAQTSGELDPASWWRSVQDRDWVGQTMPAVRSVKEGVAPLGRTLMRAVTILTIGGQDQTS
ncbi:MAG: hypothetical protein ACR2NZ_05650 [Rubripirellula sp.]